MKDSKLKEIDNSNLKNEVLQALEGGNGEAFVDSLYKFNESIAKDIEDRILKEAKEAINENLSDKEVMLKRGLNPLTKDEENFYNEVIGGASFSGTEELTPPTIFDRVFEDLRQKHPLLAEINFTNTTGISEWVSRDGDVEAAWWGQLCAEIQKKLEMAFKKERTGLFKLSAYVPVCKAMLVLGPVWLDRFVREMLYESISIALELAIVAGTGKEQPIGIIKDLDGSVVAGEYPNKAAVVLPDLSPESMGVHIMAPMTKEGTRTVDDLIFIVNPLDYWAKIFPATAFLSHTGTYVHGVLPIPAKVVQSVAMPLGKMAAGMAKDYFMGVGMNTVLEHSDHYKFLEDERTYLSKMYANGKPLDNSSFLILDISGISTVAPTQAPQASPMKTKA